MVLLTQHTQQASAASKSELSALVDTMLSLSLSFAPDRTEDGAVVQRLQPVLDAFGSFGDEIKCDVGPQRHGVRQQVQREVEREAARRRPVVERASRYDVAPVKEHTKQSLVTLDFFGRPVAAPAPPTPAKVERKELRVFYRYHEGYSNAVRKAIKLSALL